MESVKKFFVYILMFVALYIFVSLASYGFILNTYKNLNNYEILSQSPKIEIVESKATNVNGYVVGRITNNTGSEIEQKYIKIDFYTENDTYLGTEYVEIKDFSKDEVLEFKSSFKYNGVEKYKINCVNSIVATSEDNTRVTKDAFMLMGIAGIIMFFYFML